MTIQSRPTLKKGAKIQAVAPIQLTKVFRCERPDCWLPNFKTDLIGHECCRNLICWLIFRLVGETNDVRKSYQRASDMAMQHKHVTQQCRNNVRTMVFDDLSWFDDEFNEMSRSCSNLAVRFMLSSLMWWNGETQLGWWATYLNEIN